MDYNLLADEIVTDPTGAGYAAMADAEIAASLSAQTIRIRQPVVVSALVERARELQITLALRTVEMDESKPPALRAICQEILSLLDGDLTATIDLDHPTATAMFTALRQYGIMSEQQAVAIDALATARTVSRAEQIGIGATVSVDDIEQSRTWPQIEALRVRLANGYNLAVAALDAAQTVPEWADLIAVIEAA